MSLRKLYPFILAATVVGLAMAGTLSVPIKEYEVPTPRRGHTIRHWRPTAHSGTPAREQISWAGLIRRRESSRNFR
jgi:hypothetical protein